MLSNKSNFIFTADGPPGLIAIMETTTTNFIYLLVCKSSPYGLQQGVTMLVYPMVKSLNRSRKPLNFDNTNFEDSI